ncbi:hypothetical protein C2G38_801117 [Gigaspora rosea]|uniref:Uncharacterized protein n=1 Tax=Gigaspora rosea TaxID=44941 RepID=A0A397TZ34_9GLOM|nr:hypothetical protein C2G38_801117 [Gigaspora rosea]
MTCVIDLEKEIHCILQSSSKLRNYNSELRDKYIKQEENFDQERKGWDRERNKWGQKLGGANTKIQKLRTHDLELINEARHLQIENARKDISLAESKAKYTTKLEEIKSLRNEIKLLKGKLDLSQKNSSKKGSKIESLKSKIIELALKITELERLKLEAISKPIVGGDNKKNITRSDDISAISKPSKNLSQYFIRGKNIDPGPLGATLRVIEKIDGIIPNHTDDKSTSISKSPRDETNKDNMLDISIKPDIAPIISENVDLHLAQPENYVSSLIESNYQMRPGLEALPRPIGGIGTIPNIASTLVSPLSAYIFLILLIIAVMWFVVFRREWGLGRKSERLQNAWAKY